MAAWQIHKFTRPSRSDRRHFRSAASRTTRRSKAKSATMKWRLLNPAVVSLPSARTARTTAGRSPTDSSSATRSAARWHHACFSLRTGEALRAPALDPIACWRVERRATRSSCARSCSDAAGAAPAVELARAGVGRHRRRRRRGLAAADMLRREGYDGPSRSSARTRSRRSTGRTSRRTTSPARAGGLDSAAAARVLHRAAASTCVLGRACVVDRSSGAARCGSRTARAATTARSCSRPAPIRCSCPFPATTARRSTTCARSPTAARSSTSRSGATRVVVVGASFIGLEVAASLRARGIDVDVVAPDSVPLERVMGAGGRTLHPAAARSARRACSISGKTVGVGRRTHGHAERRRHARRRPRRRSASACGRRRRWPKQPASRSIAASSSTSISRPARRASSPPATSRAGPIRTPASASASSTGSWRERQGQTAARNMLGRRERFDAVPFFWSQHYDVVDQLRRPRRAVGRGPGGRVARQAGLRRSPTAERPPLAVATISRDRASLQAEVELNSSSRFDRRGIHAGFDVLTARP